MTFGELADELLGTKRRQKSTEKQLGFLPKVIAVLIEKTGIVYGKLKRVIVKRRQYDTTANILIYGHATHGIWNTDKWGVHDNAFEAWNTDYDSGDLI